MKVIMTKTKNVFFGLMMAILLMATVTLQAHAGSIVAWGGDEYGQVSTTPVGADFTAIAAGGATSYALRSDGSIAAWGLDDLGQVSSAPTESDFMRIAVGYDHGYALRSDGSIAAWGNNDSGQVSSTPTEASFTAIAGGGRNGYALRADGSIAAWGNDDFDQVSTAPTEAGFTAIVAGFYHAYALRADGSIAAWGSDGESQVSGTPAETGFLDISAGSYHGYALRSDGSIAAWGSDFNLQVSGAPTGSGFKAIGSVAFHSYALRADGSIAAWGLNCDGQVFNTPTESSPGFTSIAAGGASGYALNAISIDLGDIVGGGNGLGTGVFLEGIDPRTGGTVGPTWAGYGNAGVSVFYDVVTNPLVDGVFVPSKAQATVMQGDDSTFGLGSLTIDTGQELEFLDVTLSLNRSFNDVSAQFGVGGDFAGFRYATNIELTSLVNNSGFTPTAVCCFFTQYGTYGEDTLGELVSLLGITQNSGFGSEYWQNRVLGFTGTPVRQGGGIPAFGGHSYMTTPPRLIGPIRLGPPPVHSLTTQSSIRGAVF